MPATNGIYEFSLRTRLVTGARSADRLGALVRELGGQRAFLVTDQGLVRAGHVARALASLQASGIETRIYDATPENPDAGDVAAGRVALGDWPADVLIGFGGGSSIDLAKGVNFVRAGGGRMEDYWGVGKAKGDLLPLIAVPTTAGTGTEVQSFALIEQPGTRQKMACGDARATPVVAILDPTLTTTLSRRVTACTGIDAIGHAVETAVTRNRNAASKLYSTAALRLAHQSFPRVLASPDDLTAREQMLAAATFAGIAIEHSMLGAAHSMANPLTAHHGIAHGQAVGMALPHVVRFNAEDPATAAAYAELARDIGLGTAATADASAVHALVERLEELLALAGFAGPLRGHGVAASGIPALAAEAARQWTAQFNPRPVTAAEFERLFARAH